MEQGNSKSPSKWTINAIQEFLNRKLSIVNLYDTYKSYDNASICTAVGLCRDAFGG